jgi:hypothetical protein
MPVFFRSIRRHIGISIPLFVLYAGAVLLATRGDVDAQVVAVLAVVLLMTLLTPVLISTINRRHLRGSWNPELQPGERVLHDGPADRYQVGYFGWLFLTDRRLVMYRVGGAEDWSVPLEQVAEVHAERYAGLFATDLRVDLTNGTAETLQVEGSAEWVQRIRAARPGSAVALSP